jgi:hypothetical protein
MLELGGKTMGWLGKEFLGNSKVYALIGKVAYKIDTAHLASLARSNKLDKELVAVLPILTSFGRVKVIDVPIGSVDIPSAREEITYSERSLKTLSAILCKYALLVKQYLQKYLNAQETKVEALDFLVQLESDGYAAISDLTWKGQSFTDEFFASSPMIYSRITEGKHRYYGPSSKASSLNFGRLQALSNKEDNLHGIFRILVDNVADIQPAQKLLTEQTLKSFLKIETETQNLFNLSQNAIFIITTKDDALNDWLFNTTPLEVSELVSAAEKEQRRKELEQKQAAERAKAEKIAREEYEERVRKEREARDHHVFSYFCLSGGGRSPLRDTSQNFRNVKTKSYYWSEEEVERFATVTQGLKKISNGREKTSLLFPFIATDSPNSFNAVTETRNFETINYLIQLRLFLRSFFDSQARLIILGKRRNLEEFKKDYPDIESGVLLVKKTIESQLTDEHSPVLIAYNAISVARNKYQSEIKNLTSFVEALDKSQKAELNQEVVSAAERVKVFLASSSLAAVGDKYLWEVLKAFATHADIRKKSYSIDEDVSQIMDKYPLLMTGNFGKYPPEVISHLLTYIKLCDSQQFM